VLAADAVALSQNTVLGNAVIDYSSCALSKALNAAAFGTALKERSWVNLY
jgi:hypothetical protein